MNLLAGSESNDLYASSQEFSIVYQNAATSRKARAISLDGIDSDSSYHVRKRTYEYLIKELILLALL